MIVNLPTQTGTSARGAYGMPMPLAAGGLGIVKRFYNKEAGGDDL